MKELDEMKTLTLEEQIKIKNEVIESQRQHIRAQNDAIKSLNAKVTELSDDLKKYHYAAAKRERELNGTERRKKLFFIITIALEVVFFITFTALIIARAKGNF